VSLRYESALRLLLENFTQIGLAPLEDLGPSKNIRSISIVYEHARYACLNPLISGNISA
jgi:hypothetical protein